MELSLPAGQRTLGSGKDRNMEGKRSAVSSKTKQYSWADGVSLTLGRTSSEIYQKATVESGVNRQRSRGKRHRQRHVHPAREENQYINTTDSSIINVNTAACHTIKTTPELRSYLTATVVVPYMLVQSAIWCDM